LVHVHGLTQFLDDADEPISRKNHPMAATCEAGSSAVEAVVPGSMPSSPARAVPTLAAGGPSLPPSMLPPPSKLSASGSPDRIITPPKSVPNRPAGMPKRPGLLPSGSSGSSGSDSA
jgi:hypothetical protein